MFPLMNNSHSKTTENLVKDLLRDDEGNSILPNSIVKSLGVKFDSSLNFENHIDKVINGCNINLRNLCVIGPKLYFGLKSNLFIAWFTLYWTFVMDYCMDYHRVS